ncbi:MAG: ion transporter [Planctomycetota bacterium]|nr:ion transporter [Planctomycetota bacterium]
MADREKLQVALERLDAIDPTKLPVDKLKALQASLRSQLSALAERANASANKAAAALEQSDPNVLEYVLAETTKLRSRQEKLDDLDTKLEDQIQRSIIQTRMIARLGSAKRVVVLEGFVMSLIVVVLGLLLYDLGAPEAGRPSWLSTGNIFLIDSACCVVFMLEFLFRLGCAEAKPYVWRNHWVDFVTSIPIPPEALLARFGRFARLARLARMARLLRFVRVFFVLWRGMDKLQGVVDVKMMKKTIRWAVAATIVGAILIYRIEGWEGADSPVWQHDAGDVVEFYYGIDGGIW